MVRVAKADLAAAVALSLLSSGCGKPATTAAAASGLITPPAAPTVPPDYISACSTALSNARTLTPSLAAANLAGKLDLKLIAPGPHPRIACPITHADDQGSVVFQLDCQDPANAVCVTVVSADLAGSVAYLNNELMDKQVKSGVQTLHLGDSN